MVHLVRGAVLAMGLALPVMADVPSAVETAFLGWARDMGVGDAALVLQHDGQTLHTLELGAITAQSPVELASLSKAITAVCAVTLVNDGTWTRATTSHEVMGAGLRGLALDALMTHSAGLLHDSSQGMRARFVMARREEAEQTANRALSRAKHDGQAGQFAYNNENYAVLGAMIAAQTGQSYEAACRDRVLHPAGVQDARVSPRTAGYLPWGGWQMSVTDYGRFMDWAYGPDGLIGARVPYLPAHLVNEQGVRYGAGMFQRPAGTGYRFWHFGKWCFPLGLNVGSFALVGVDGWQLVASYDICASEDQMGALFKAVNRALVSGVAP